MIHSVLDNGLAAGHHQLGVPFHREAFEHGIIHTHVMRLGADRVFRSRIPHHDIGVAAGGQRALARIEAEQPGWRRRHQFDEAVHAHPPQIHAVVIQKLQPILDARATVGNLGEIVLAQRLLVLDAERAVIGRNHLQVIALQPVPQLRRMMFLAQRRRENVFGAFEAGPGQLFHREQQILRAGLGEGGHASVARFAHLVERVLRRQVHDVHRRPSHLREGDSPVHGFRFGRHRTRQGVMDRRGLALGESAAHDHVDDPAVLGVHADQRPVLRRAGERLENGRVVHHEDAGIGHEQFEAGHAVGHHGIHVVEAALAQVGDDHVQAVVDRSAAIGLFPPGVEGIAHARAFGLDGEIDERGGAAKRRRARAGFEIVAGSGSAEWHVQMRVDVDAAGQQQHAGGVDDAAGRLRGKRGRDVANLFAIHQDVGGDALFGRDYGSVSNQCSGHVVIIAKDDPFRSPVTCRPRLSRCEPVRG